MVKKIEKKKECCCDWKKLNFWKIGAVAVVVIFVLIVAGGLFRLYHFKATFADTTLDQSTLANKVVSNDMKSRGESLADYEITIASKTRSMRFEEDTSRTVLSVLLQNNNTRQMYLIDANSGELITHSSTTDYIKTCDKSGKFGEKDEREEEGKGPGRFRWQMMDGMYCNHRR
jgi:hypothetical protein